MVRSCSRTLKRILYLSWNSDSFRFLSSSCFSSRSTTCGAGEGTATCLCLSQALGHSKMTFNQVRLHLNELLSIKAGKAHCIQLAFVALDGWHHLCHSALHQDLSHLHGHDIKAM